MHFDAQGNILVGSHAWCVQRANDVAPDVVEPVTTHLAGVPPVEQMTPNGITPAQERNRGGGQPLRKDQVWPMGQRPPREKPEKKPR